MPGPDAIRMFQRALAPYLAALAFPLAMWLGNLAEEPTWLDLVATFGLALLIAAAGEGVWWVASRWSVRCEDSIERRSAARIVGLSTFILFCFGYGHIYNVLAPQRILHRQLLPVWLAAWLLVWGLLYVVRRGAFIHRAATIATAVSPMLLVVQLGSALPSFLGAWPSANESHAAAIIAPDENNLPLRTARPDIYYIILDGYARQDVLREIHGFDNEPFVAALRQRGFFIPEQARSNYAQTRLSLASSLSMDYLPIDPSDEPYDTHHAVVRGLRQNSRVAARLKQAGYRYRYVGNPYFPRDPAADEQYLLGEQGADYIQAFVATTVFGRLVHHVLKAAEYFSGPVEVHRFQLANVPRAKSVPGPLFTFAHLCCPHWPYVYDRNGPLPEPVPEGQMTSRHYVEQLQYLNGRVLELIDAIDRTSGRDAVVILQADHGSDDYGLPPSEQPDQRMPDAPSERHLFERMSIFCAYRIPPDVGDSIYPTMTPVNSFRLLFNGLFDDRWPLLPDRSLYSTYKTPYRWIEAPAEVTSR
jgi:hypothetical protein